MVEGGLGWIIVDSLDTMIIMNLTSQVRHARQWISTSLQYNQNHDVSTFETTVRMLGGLLSAHYLSTQYPDLAPIADDDAGAAGEDLYIEKAADLADRLLGAFETPSGIPYSSINLNTSTGIRSHDGGAASTAEATTVQLEFKYLAKLTGEAEYWRVVEEATEVVDAQKAQDGLVPIYIRPETGHFSGTNIRLDSYYGASLLVPTCVSHFSNNTCPQNTLSSNISKHPNKSPFIRNCGMRLSLAFGNICLLSPRIRS